MIAKNMFNIRVVWKSNPLPIIEASRFFYIYLKNLSKINSSFFEPILSKESHRDVPILVNKLSKDEVVKLIANSILNFSKKDIRKYEKELNPTIDYSRDFGFSFVLRYLKEEMKRLISFNVVIGCSNYGGMSSLNVNLDDNNFTWYFNLLQALSSVSLTGVVDIRDLSYNEMCKQYTKPLGWITYFSNEYELEIPDDLEGFEYEYTDKGKYLIATREDFTQSKEFYDKQKEKLLRTMEYLGKTVPGYLVVFQS